MLRVELNNMLRHAYRNAYAIGGSQLRTKYFVSVKLCSNFTATKNHFRIARIKASSLVANPFPPGHLNYPSPTTNRHSHVRVHSPVI
jgi:hypothetical protein